MTVALHPFADEWTDEYALYAASATRVTLTAPLRHFIEDCRAESLRPVILTSEDASLSGHVLAAMRDAAGFWIFRSPDGTYDAASGRGIRSIADLWAAPEANAPGHPAYVAYSPAREGALLFDVYVTERAVEETRIGPLVEHMLTGLGASPVDRWGREEPLTAAWSAEALTDTVRAQMPASDRYLVATPDQAWARVTVARTRRGLLQHVNGAVPIGPYGAPRGIDPAAAPAAHPAVTETLAGLVRHHRPNVALISYGEFSRVSAGYGRVIGAARPDVPLAVLIGPRAVRDLRVDVADLQARHDVTVLGPGRVPSLLVRLSGREPLWAQLRAFAHDLDQERLAAALAVEFREVG